MNQRPVSTNCEQRRRRSPGGRISGLAALLLLSGLAGCSSIGPFRGPADRSPIESGSAPVAPPPGGMAEAEPAPPPAAPPAPPVAPAPVEPAPRPRILVLRSSDADNYLGVAENLRGLLRDDYDLLEVNLAAAADAPLPASVVTAKWTAAVAIGTDAAAFAATELQIPVVICQIFDYAPLLAQHANFIGVEPLPPLELQLKSWKQIDPDATSLGIIVTADETELVTRAKEAAATFGLSLHAAIAATDQDALYQFKRFSEDVDALWLQPNSGILSPTVLQEMIDYALGHQVQTIVFNRALLDWGALLSVGSDTAEVAATVTRALGDIVDVDTADVARVWPLASVDVHFNEDVAGRLGVFGSSDVARAKQLVTARDDDS